MNTSDRTETGTPRVHGGASGCCHCCHYFQGLAKRANLEVIPVSVRHNHVLEQVLPNLDGIFDETEPQRPATLNGDSALV